MGVSPRRTTKTNLEFRNGRECYNKAPLSIKQVPNLPSYQGSFSSCSTDRRKRSLGSQIREEENLCYLQMGPREAWRQAQDAKLRDRPQQLRPYGSRRFDQDQKRV